MKVAYLLGSLNRGGAETLMLDVYRNADKAPFEMMGVHRKGGAYQDAFYSAGPKMVQLAPKRLGYVRYFMQLRKLLKAEGIDVIHTQYWLDCIYAWIATVGMDVRVVNTFHGFYSMKGIVGALCRLSIRMADDVCFVSLYEQEWYQAHTKIADSKCHVIYNGIDFEKFEVIDDRCIDNRLTSIEERGLERGRRKVESGQIRLCMVGNFMSGRDHATLIDALKVLHQRGISDFEFYFIGRRSDAEPQIYDECVHVCEENGMKHVHFLGARSDVPSLLKTMDGFVYSTAHDTFGIAVVEAMAVGLPVVVNDWPVMLEIGGDATAYFKSKKVEDCAAAIEKLLEELPQRKETAKKNAEVVRDRYSIEAYIQRLNKIYSLIEDR